MKEGGMDLNKLRTCRETLLFKNMSSFKQPDKQGRVCALVCQACRSILIFPTLQVVSDLCSFFSQLAAVPFQQ